MTTTTTMQGLDLSRYEPLLSDPPEYLRINQRILLDALRAAYVQIDTLSAERDHWMRAAWQLAKATGPQP